ncbi:MAG: hypothetical protein IPL78_23440 [Chloroflexi bacterium]|nr:hypothetical protein [Chloroflexota bacterium]
MGQKGAMFFPTCLALFDDALNQEGETTWEKAPVARFIPLNLHRPAPTITGA